MLERLVENWLDSANERSYQAPFCQILAANGHTIIHSTRHAPTEFGKDVITVDSDGTPWAFQLKGNPGARLTKTQVAEIATQLDELAMYPIDHPGVPKGWRHNSVLVTNGQIDEEASQAIQRINASLSRRGHGRIQTWSRGKLLKLATELGATLWPSELEELNTFLELLVHPGTDMFPAKKLHRLLQQLLRLSETHAQPVSKAELSRRITSAALLVAVSLRTFTLRQNHFATLTAWLMFFTYAVAAVEKHKFKLNGSALASIPVARATVMDALASLCGDIITNPKLAPETGSVIAEIYGARATLLYGLMSVYWLWSENAGWLVPAHKEFLDARLPKDFNKSHIWGEACIPQLLAHYWYFSHHDATMASDLLLGKMIELIVLCARGKIPILWASPYYGFETVQRHAMGGFLPAREDPLNGEAPNGRSFFATSLLEIFARRNLKLGCQQLWPSITKLFITTFEPEARWAFGLVDCERGTETTMVPKLGRRWIDLVEDTRDCRTTHIPPALLDNEFLLALFLIAFPYRAMPEVLRYLDMRLGSSWMIAPAVLGE